MATRLIFGDNEAQKLLIDNQRRGRQLTYAIKDLFSKNIIAQGAVSSFSSFDTPVLNTSSGTVYEVSIRHQGDTFPTYNYTALPSASNAYYWVHKGDNLVTTPTQSSFPALYPVLNQRSISVINDMTDEDPNGTVMTPVTGLAIGGYVTTSSSPWRSRDYLPSISGYIQQKFDKASISGDFAYTNQTYSLTIPTNSIKEGYNLSIDLYRYNWNNTLITPPVNVNLVVAQSDLTNDTTLKIINNQGSFNFNGKYTIKFISAISGIINNSNIVIKHNNLPFTTGDIISIDQGDNASTDLYFMDRAGSLSVSYRDDTVIYVGQTNSSDTSWTGVLDLNNPVELMKNYDDNIKIMPYYISNFWNN